MKLREVVITGAGVVSPFGLGREALFAGLLAGRSALRPLTGFEAGPFPCRIGGQVPDFKGKDWVDNRKNLKIMTPAVQFGLAGVRLAATEAGLQPGAGVPAERLGMFVGAGTAFGDMPDLLPAIVKATGEGTFDGRRFAVEGMPAVNPLWLLKGLSNNVLGFASAALDAQGINQNYCNSAVGGLQALGEGAWAIAEGRADAIVAGGADSAANPEHLTGFGRLEVLTTSGAVRPFDARHDGFAPGEGAAFFVLEAEAHARARGAPVLARVVGYGNGCGVAALGGGDPVAVEAACRQALETAGWAPGDVDALHAHGNGNPSSDQVEARAFGAVFGERGPPITADKGQIGHAVAAAGPLAVAVALEGLRRGLLPPIATLEEVDAACRGLDLVREAPREVRLRRALVHASGLGGQTTFLALEAA